MKNSKKLLTLFLTVAMAMSMFVGCGQKEAAPAEEASTGEAATEVVAETGEASAESVIDFEEAPYEVVMELVTLGQDFASIPAMEEAINAITLPAINATVKFIPVHIADHATKLNLMAAGGEKVDLVVTGITTPLAGLAANGTLLPMDDLLAERAQALVEKQGDLINAFKFNSEIFSVSANLYPASSGGILYNKDMADQYGITVPEKVTLEDLEKIAEQLKAANPELYLTTPGDGALCAYGQFYPVSNFGGDYNYGVIFDPANSTEIENFYASEEFKGYVTTLKERMDKGYIPADAVTSGQNGQDVFRAGKTFYQWTNVSPLDRVTQASQWPFAVDMAPATDVMLSTEVVQEFGWGIPATCERPEKAVDFLNLMYTNADLSNILNNGLEGVEYKKVSDNIIAYADGINFGNTGYARIFNRFGDTMQTFQWQPATEDYYSELQAFNDSAVKSKTLGYVFNAENVATELAAVSSVVTEYRPALMTGMIKDVDSALADFNKALDDAGINVIIEENKAQLAAWLETQK